MIAKLLPKKQFARNVSILMGGTVIAQAISLAISPIITRLYTPAEFGLLAIFTSIVGIVGVFSTFRYHMAIPLPRWDCNAINLVALSGTCVIVVTFLTTLLTVAFGSWAAKLLGAQELAPYMILVPVALLFGGIYTTLSYWAIRTSSFRTIAYTQISQTVVSNGVKTFGASLGPIGLILGFIASQAVGISRLAKNYRETKKGSGWKISFYRIRRLFFRYKRFPLYSSWARFLNAIGGGLPLLLFSAFFTPAIAGVFFIAHKVLALPIGMIGKSVGNVFFASAASAKNDGEVNLIVEQTYRYLTYMGMPFTLLLIYTSPFLFPLVFGENWRLAGTFAQWMAPWMLLTFTISPLSTVYSVSEKQVHELGMQAMQIITRVIAILIGALFEDFIFALALFSLASCLHYLTVLIFVCKFSGAPIARLLRITTNAGLLAFCATLPVALLSAGFISTNLVPLVCFVILSIILLCLYFYPLIRNLYSQ